MEERKGEGTRGEHNEGTRDLKVSEIVKRLEREYPDPKLELEYENPFQLLVEAILAAQESDKKVNKIREEFFGKYPNPESIAKAPLEELERDLSSINFYRRKAKLLKECCRKLVEEFGGEVPKTVEEMVRLPGVGRKTANMVIGGAYGLPAVIVDRHVLRVSKRLGLAKEEEADRVEMELRGVVPEDLWTRFSLLLMNHGKRICKAKSPECAKCPLCDLCDSCEIK